MMISPEAFIEEYKNKSYAELLPIRDELLEEIREFENHTYNPEMNMVYPSPEVVDDHSNIKIAPNCIS